MKKLVLFVLVMLVAATISTVSAQRSKAYSGDKSSHVITKSQETFKSLVADLKDQKNDLEKKRRKLSKNSAYNSALLIENDSLIRVYQTRIMTLEDQMVVSITTAASKDQENRIELKSRDVTALADAYLTVKYADNMSAGINSGGASTGKKLVGIVENCTYDNPVVVKISGPGNSKIFTREFTLGSRQKSPEFELPVAGKYTASFVSSRGNGCVTKPVGINTVYYDGAKQLDFKASFIY